MLISKTTQDELLSIIGQEIKKKIVSKVKLKTSVAKNKLPLLFGMLINVAQLSKNLLASVMTMI